MSQEGRMQVLLPLPLLYALPVVFLAHFCQEQERCEPEERRHPEQSAGACHRRMSYCHDDAVVLLCSFVRKELGQKSQKEADHKELLPDLALKTADSQLLRESRKQSRKQSRKP